MPAISESIPPQAGPSWEVVEYKVAFGTSFQVNVEERLKSIIEIQLKGIPEGVELTPIHPITTLTEPVISRVQAPLLAKPIY